jgi:DNA polymerase
MKRCFLDIETFSETPIKNGVHAYAQAAQIILFAYAFDDGPVTVWDCAPNRMPDDLAAALCDHSVELVAHNASFERTLFAHAGSVIEREAARRVERWHCTMARAMAHSLPGALASLCDVLAVDLDKAKDKVGRQLITLFCQPRPKNMKLRRATAATHPEEWKRFKDYAVLDVISMREVDKKLPRWNYKGRELELWRLDQRINDRGVAVDLEFAHAAIAAATRAQAALASQTSDLTGGAVASATQRDALLAHILAEHGVTLPDMQSSTLERRIADPELPAAVRELLMIRLQASSTSVAKYGVLGRVVSEDGRMRGLMQFCGAGRTGRWAHRLFQPGNMPRPTLDNDDIDFGIEAVKAGCEDLIYGNVIELLTSAVRGCIVAAPGKKLTIADLSNIEGRKAAWLAGESWKLRAFRDFDAGKGADLYKVAYAKAFAIDPADVVKDQRQIGKVMELMLQYQGGVGAFITGADTYGIDLAAMAEAALPSVPGDVKHEAEGFYDWCVQEHRSTFNLPRHVFVACDSLKRLWRRAHPSIESYWRDLEDTYQQAISNPGVTLTCRRLRVRRDGAWLRVVLPSGRALCYPSPRIEPDGKITYMGLDQYTRQWKRLGLYGGKALEQATQASSRDQLAGCMPLIEDAGYPLIFTVHDEDICETPDTPEFSCARLAELMCSGLGWNEGLPLAAAGFETYRYRKG